MTSEGDVQVILGPQGGFHIWLAARCQDCSDQVLMIYGVRGSADGEWLSGMPLRGIVNLEAVDGWLQIVGLYGLLPGSPSTVDYTDLSLVLDLTIEDEERVSSRAIPVHVANVEVWDCEDEDPEICPVE